LATRAATREVISDDEDEPATSSVDSSLPVEQQKEAATDDSSSSQEDDESDQFELRRETRGRGSVQCKICQKVCNSFKIIIICC